MENLYEIETLMKEYESSEVVFTEFIRDKINNGYEISNENLKRLLILTGEEDVDIADIRNSSIVNFVNQSELERWRSIPDEDGKRILASFIAYGERYNVEICHGFGRYNLSDDDIEEGYIGFYLLNLYNSVGEFIFEGALAFREEDDFGNNLNNLIIASLDVIGFEKETPTDFSILEINRKGDV